MPEAADPFISVGYLAAAVAVTIVGLAGYGIALAQRLASARHRSRELWQAQEAERRGSGL